MTIQELELKIIEARDAYYNSDPIMSDDEYNKLESLLEQMDPKNKLLQEIGTDSNEGFAKAKHTILMGSQQKFSTIEDLTKKLDSFKKKENVFVVTEKLDGISLELNYKNGKLISAITRGDGYIGDDITRNAIKMQSVLKQLPEPVDVSIRGEILLKVSDRDKYFPEMKSCRNACAGISRRLDGEGSDHLTVICYDIASDKVATEEAKLDLLQKYGFEIVNFKVLKIKSGELGARELHDAMKEFMTRDKDYDTDGVVVKLNEFDLDDLKSNIRPNTQWAIKPETVTKFVTLLNIEWNMANGTLTPIAVFDPVEIDGALIRRSTLNNVRYLERAKIEIGDIIELERAGMVIPRVVGNKSKGIFL